MEIDNEKFDEMDVEYEADDGTIFSLFDYLPNELLIKIFDYLNHNDLKTIRLVCNRWFQSLQFTKIEEKILLKITKNFDLAVELFSKSIQQYPNILISNINVDIKLSNFIFGRQLQSIIFDTIVFKERNFLKILNCLEDVQEIEIINCIFIFDIENNPIEMEIIQQSNAKLNQHYDFATSLNMLKSFTFLDIPRDSYRILLKIKEIIKPNTLEKLKISIVKPLEGQEQFESLISETCCDSNLILVFVLKQKVTLKELEIHDMSRNCCKQKIFNNLVELNGLGIYNSIALNDHDIVFLTKNLTNLSKFSVKSCHSLTNLSALAMENLTKIKELTISECSGILAGINSSGIKNGIAKNQNMNMDKLCLIFMDLNSDCMVKLSEQFKNLTVFIYQYPVTKSRYACKITDFAVQSLLKNLKLLKILDIMGCQWTTDNGITGFDFITKKQVGYTINDLKNLENLNLIGCDKISDFFILRDFSLTNLKILRIPQLSLEGISILSRKCPYIEFLEFQNDYETDVVLSIAIENFHFLKKVKIMRFCIFSRKRMEIRAQRFEQNFSNIGIECPCSVCVRIIALCSIFQKIGY